MSRRRVRMGATRASVVGAGVVAALGLGACGSSDSSSTATGQTTAAAASSGLTSKDIGVVQKFTGGTSGKATGTPIKVGLVTSNSGPTGQPYLAQSSRNAIQIVNEKLGGIDGHPIQLVACNFGSTAQQGQNCGSTFANDSSIKAVLFTGGTVGGPQLHAANNGAKTYFCTVASPGDYTAKNTFCTSAGVLASGAILTYVKDFVKAKSVSINSIDDPTLQAVLNQQRPQYAAQGIKATTGASPAGATDVTSSLVASGAQNADATVLELPLAAVCPAYVKGLKTLAVTKPVISLLTCSDPPVVKAVGSVPDFTYLSYGQSSNLPDPTGQVDVFKHANTTYGDATGENSEQAFGTALLLAKTMNELGADKLTTAALSAKMAAYTGPAFLGDPDLKFGAQPAPSVGSTRGRFFTHKADGSWVDATGGKWLTAPAAQ